MRLNHFQLWCTCIWSQLLFILPSSLHPSLCSTSGLSINNNEDKRVNAGELNEKRETKNWRCKSANVMCRMLVASKICTSWTGKRSLLTWMNKKSSASILARQWNSMFLFPPLIWEHYMGINILFFCVSLPAWSFSLFILSKPLMKFWNAMLGWRVDVPAASWVLQTLLFAKGFLCLISPWDSGPVTPGIKIRLWGSVHKKKENISTPSPKYTF